MIVSPLGRTLAETQKQHAGVVLGPFMVIALLGIVGGAIWLSTKN